MQASFLSRGLLFGELGNPVGFLRYIVIGLRYTMIGLKLNIFSTLWPPIIDFVGLLRFGLTLWCRASFNFMSV